MNEKKILIIDDEPNICQLTKLNLESTGEYKVSTAFSGKEGLRKAKKENFDLVITDFKIPDMDGGEILNRLKEMDPHLPVLLFSIYYDDPSTVAKSTIRKADGLISKPFDHKQLCEIIKDVLSKSQRRKKRK